MAQGFKAAFAAARKAGKKEFTWNGKRYNTKYKEEVSSAPSKSKIPTVKPAKGKVSSGRGDVQATGAPKVKASSGRGAIQASAPVKPVEAGSRPKPKAPGESVAPKISSKPVDNPRNAPSFADKLRMGSSDRGRANLRAREMERRRAFTASRAGKG